MLFRRVRRSSGEILVLVTGGHEGGELALTQASSRKQFQPVFAARLHTADLVPVFAYGPGAKKFSGIYEHTALHGKMMGVLGLGE